MGSARAWDSPPPFTPLPFGLLSVADPAPITAREVHWRNGVKFQPDHCSEAGIAEARCIDSPLTLEPAEDGLPVRGADPFSVFAWLPCGPLGYADLAEAERRTDAALTNTEQTAAERAFWTGTGQSGGDPIYPHLAANADHSEGTPGQTEVIDLQTSASVIVTGALDVTEGLGALEGALSQCYSGVGVLHIPRELIAHLSSRGLIERNGNQLRTTAGTLVAAGAGYTGTGPNGAQPTSGALWAYITGAVRYWRSGVEHATHDWSEAIDRTVNGLVMISSRVYVIGWDCCHFAVQISTGGTKTGTAGAAT